jgi:hypothetical protein
MERAYRVDVMSTPSHPSYSPLVFTEGTNISLTWNPQDVFPQSAEPFNVDVLLYMFHLDLSQYVRHSILAENKENNGNMIVTIPSGISSDVVPIALQVAKSLHPSEFIPDGLFRDLFFHRQRVGIWSSEYYYVNSSLSGIDDQSCQEWNQLESKHAPLSDVPCAPTLPQVQMASSGLSEIVLESVYGNFLYRQQWLDTFHEGSAQCFRQTVLDRT